LPEHHKITLRKLLQMSAGWYEDRPQDYDVAFGPWSQAMLKRFGTALPPTSQDALAYMLTTNLEFEPGTTSSYSNFSYNTLGLVISALSNSSYEQYVQQTLFLPLQCKECRLGNSQEPKDNTIEPKYYVIGESEFRHYIERHLDGLPYGETSI